MSPGLTVIFRHFRRVVLSPKEDLCTFRYKTDTRKANLDSGGLGPDYMVLQAIWASLVKFLGLTKVSEPWTQHKAKKKVIASQKCFCQVFFLFKIWRHLLTQKNKSLRGFPLRNPGPKEGSIRALGENQVSGPLFSGWTRTSPLWIPSIK